MDAIYDLRDMLCDELEQAMSNSRTEMSLDTIDKLTHSLKSVETIIAMKEGGYSTSVRSYRNNSYGNESYRGYRDNNRYNDNYNSYRMGRRNGGYSREDGKEDMISQLHDMMKDASSKEKDAIRQCIDNLENM